MVAGSYGRFLQWCRQVDANPRDPEMTYVQDESSLRGVSGGLLLILDGAHSRPDVALLVATARSREMKVAYE